LVIQMKGVYWLRERRIILNDISWNVNEHEHWAIVGLNGSGKTSLLNIISGYSFPSRGEVSVLGKTFGSCDLRELRKLIGIVSSFLQEKLHPEETVEDIILSGQFASIGLYDKPTASGKRQARSLMEQFGIAEFAMRRYSSLSQGERQKILLARSLVNSPKLLILDEPCTGLDIFSRESLLTMIEQIGALASGPTIMYVSHHVDEILKTFGHTLLLRRGSVHSAGRSEKVLTGPNLTDFFECEVEVNWRHGRPQVHI